MPHTHTFYSPGRPAHPPIPAETEQEFLGNGEWPFERQSDNPAPSQPIPPPPVEGVDSGRKDAYKMTARPRGTGEYSSNRVLYILQ